MSDARNITPTSDCVTEARAFAIAAHGTQKYAGRPYVFHLDVVATLLAPYGADAQVMGYLHDVVEDTTTTLEQVRAAFGDRVAECVRLVTDEQGANRPERKSRTNAKLAKVAADGDTALALIVKAADRLANLRMSAGGDGDAGKLDMYRREHHAFRAAAFRAELCDDLWAEMDRIVG